MVDDIKPGNPDEHTPPPEDATKLTVTDDNDTSDDANTENNAPSTDEAPTEEITEETTEEKPLTPETDDLAADIAVMETPEGGDTKTDESEAEETETEETDTTPTEESPVEESPAEDTQHESDQQEEKPDEEPAEENPQENEEEKSDEQSGNEPAEPQTVAVAEGTDSTTAEADPLGDLIGDAESDETLSTEQDEESDDNKPDEAKEAAETSVSNPAEEEATVNAPEPETLQAVDAGTTEDSGKDEPATPPVMPGQAVEAKPDPEAEQKQAEKQAKEEKKTAKKAKGGSGMNLVIVLAVLVAFLLIGLAFVALQSDDEAVSDLNSQTSDINETSQIVEEDVNNEPVDEAEVQEQITGIDETLEALDEGDFSEDELSDESLGL